MKVELINLHTSRRFIANHHYAIVSPSMISVHLGQFDNGHLVGVCQLGYGTRPRQTIKRLFPSLDTPEYWEIGRLCMLPEMPSNSESHFLRGIVKWIKQNYPKKKVLFTWADGLRGKPGYIYQASNFLYGGYIWSEFYATRDLEIVHPRLLVTRYGTRNKAKTTELGLTKIWGKQFRYIKFLCSHRERKWLLLESPINWNIDYPKQDDLEWQVQAGQGSRESCQLPKLKGLGQFQRPAPLLELLTRE